MLEWVKKNSIGDKVVELLSGDISEFSFDQ